ncbi:MAG: hypothetical protein M3461_17260 [Pseudomonadota bacterium]|nr:hypothetical protein [Pseudomonadota bacterium]
MPDDEFQIIDIEPGSTIVTVELPIEAAELLVDLTKADPELFAQYRLTSGEIVVRPETQHALPNRPDRVALDKEGRRSELWRALSPFGLLGHSGPSRIIRKEDDSDVA